MVQIYKKYGVTTGGYRGERAILKERVIEGGYFNDNFEYDKMVKFKELINEPA